MIVRRCSQGHRVRLHRNTTPSATRVKTYPDGTKETLTYPSSYDYFVDVDGTVAKKSNSFKFHLHIHLLPQQFTINYSFIFMYLHTW